MDSEFKDKLMNADAAESPARLEYERKLAAMLESPLNGSRKAGLVFGTIVGIGTAVLCAVLMIRFRHAPAILPAGLAIGAIFGIAVAIVAGRILLRGTYRHRGDTVTQANVIWVFTVMLTTMLMLMEGLYSKTSVRLTVFGIVFLIGAAVMLLRTVIEQSELRTREKLLEMQYEMAELKEAMRKEK